VIVASPIATSIRNGFTPAAAVSRQRNRSQAPSRHEASAFAVAVIQLARVIPADHVHEGVHIRACSRAVIDVIGVLIHVEREDRLATGERRRVVGGPLIYEALTSW
jgi:hypothetical protein